MNQNFGLDYNRGRNTSVTDRARPEYSPTGVPIGAFMLFPSLTTQLVYVDNVFATPSGGFPGGLGHVGDGIVSITPSATILSNWSRNAVSLSADVNENKYFKYTENDTTNYGVTANGRLDILDADNIGGSVYYDQLTEPRTSSAVAENSFDPSRYTQYGGSIHGLYQLNRLRFLIRGDYNNYDYQNLTDEFGGLIQNDLRNNAVYDLSVRADYAVNQDAAVFASVLYNDRDFEFSSEQQNSHGYEFLGGVNLDVTNFVRGEIGLGYLIQDYRDGATQSGFAAQTRFQYFPSPLLTLGFTAERSLQNSTIINSSGAVVTNVGLRADYELRRNILLYTSFNYYQDDYSGINFESDRYSVGVGGSYLVNRLLSFNVSYNYQTQTTNGASEPLSVSTATILSYPFDVNSVYIGFTLHR